MKNVFLLILSVLMYAINVNSQTVRTVKDPSGNEILLHTDSSFLTKHNDLLFLYTIDKANDERNILVTNGDTSYWLFDTGFGKEVSFTDFINRYNEELVFRIGGTWYITEGSPASTHIFYDNNEPSNEFEYLKLFEFQANNIAGYNLAIEAINKSTGDTLILYHNTEFQTTTTYAKRLRILEANLDQAGPFTGSFFMGSVFDEINQFWGEVGIYREFGATLKLLLPLGSKQIYKTNSNNNERIVDHQEDGTKKVYEYTSSIDSFIEITESAFPNYTVLEYQRLKWTAYGHPWEPPQSYYDSYWKGKNQGGSIRYYTRNGFEEDFEIVDLRNVPEADFILSGYTEDTIYYYNYSNTQRGLIRYNIFDGGSKKDPTSVPFTQEYKLKGYLDKIYFGRYSSQSGKIEAIAIDFTNEGRYGFLESTNGKRIENPVDFTFLDDKVFVHSRTQEGLKLVVYDPDGIVAVENQPQESKSIVVAPNPSSGLFNVSLKGLDFTHQDINFVVTNTKGITVLKGKVTGPEYQVDLTGKPNGSYNLTLLSKESLLFTTTLVLISK
jgi:hypothetical protein